MKSPNYRHYSKKEIWAQERAILKNITPEYERELISCCHLKKFRPKRWQKLAPAVKLAAQTLWWTKFMRTPAGSAYQYFCYSEPPHPHDPVLDRVGGKPDDRVNCFEWEYPTAAYWKPPVQSELFSIDGKGRRNLEARGSRYELEKQLSLVEVCQPELF